MVDHCDCCRGNGYRKLPDSDGDILANKSVHELGLYDFASRDCQSYFPFASPVEPNPVIHRHSCFIHNHNLISLRLALVVLSKSVRRIRVDERVFWPIWMDAMDVVGNDGLFAISIPVSMES